MILGHFLVISLALNAGFLYRDYFNGKSKFQEYFTFKHETKNGSLLTNTDALQVSSSSKSLNDQVIDLDQ